MKETLSQRRMQALKLKKEMDNIEKAHKKHIDNFEAKEKLYTPQQRVRANKAFVKMEEKYAELEDEAYKKYYNHMHKDFNPDKTKTDFRSKKYKEGFCDKQYIEDMYTEKKNSLKKKESSRVKKAKR